jgi:hypothetical protein
MDSAQGKALLLFQYFIMDDIQSVVILDFYFPCFSLVQFITLNKITIGTPSCFLSKKYTRGMREERPLSFLHAIAIAAQRLQMLRETDD